ncbi:MAG: sulfite exporter TauE/SafE family protein [Candidatus Fermentibacter sp.]|nr:sulfite exporter TauE/SafE family protein [Candidatus Fermentibacter sp.]
MTLDPLIRGAALGLATGTACLASCGPVYGAYLLSEKRSGPESLRVLLELNLGRFLAYAAFGALFGLLGGSLPVSIRGPLAAAGYILFSIYLLLSVVRARKSCGGCSTSRLTRITRSPLLLGVLTGLSVCPSFLIAVTGAFESSGPVSGAMLFTGFFAGTTVYMLPFAVLGLFTRKAWFTTVARVLAVVVSVYFLAVGVRMALALIGPGGSQTSGTAGLPSDGGGPAYAALEEDTLYFVGITGDPADHAQDLAVFFGSQGGPGTVFVAVDPADPTSFAGRIPELSPVIVPWWVDPRSGIALEPWQAEFAWVVEARRYRAFAVEYEPWCEDRAGTIRSFLDRYSFSVAPDSGFTFLMQNTLECPPDSCATCPLGAFE